MSSALDDEKKNDIVVSLAIFGNNQGNENRSLEYHLVSVFFSVDNNESISQRLFSRKLMVVKVSSNRCIWPLNDFCFTYFLICSIPSCKLSSIHQNYSCTSRTSNNWCFQVIWRGKIKSECDQCWRSLSTSMREIGDVSCLSLHSVTNRRRFDANREKKTNHEYIDLFRH